MILLQIDLLGLNAKDLEWYQMAIRAVLVFFLALAFIRIAGMRTFGTHSAFDVVVTITLGAVLSRGITGNCPFFPCLGAAMILALLHRLVAFLSYRSKAINKLIEGDSIPLFKDGKKIRKNLSKHSILDKELTMALHEQNIDDFNKAESLWFEPDGKISVVKKNE